MAHLKVRWGSCILPLSLKPLIMSLPPVLTRPFKTPLHLSDFHLSMSLTRFLQFTQIPIKLILAAIPKSKPWIMITATVVSFPTLCNPYGSST